MRQIEKNIRTLEATEERQYMLNDCFEAYEKHGAPVGAMSFHYHDFYEIMYVLEGEYSALIENQIYHLRKGDFLMIAPNMLHKYNYEEKKHDSSKRIILWITEQMLLKLSQGETNLAECFAVGRTCAYHFPIYYEEMLRGYLLKLVMADVPENSLKAVLDRGYLTLFFGYLNLLCSRREYLAAGEEIALHPLVLQAGNYMDEHISEKITVERLADHVHMSKYHFLRRFKELTGVTVHGYLTNKRLIKACEELKAGSSIEQAYQRAGFADYSSFLRNFKNAYGVAPKKYKDFYPD